MTQPPLVPGGRLLTGHMQAFAADTLEYLLHLRQYGDLCRIRFGPFKAYVVNHPDYARHILVTDAKHYHKDITTKRVLSDSAGNGLFTNDGEPWKRQRKLVQPAFHTQRIAAYADVMVEYAGQMADKWHEGLTCDIDHEMTELTMRIVSKTLFDVDIADKTDHIGDSISRILHVINKRFNRLVSLPRWLPTPENRAMRSAIHTLDAQIQAFIDEWRKTGVDKGDLLSMLLMAQDDSDGGGMTDQQVRDEAVQLFVAGHETTANALIWTWYLLSQSPEVEARLHAELSQVLGGRNPVFSDLEDLRYTEMVIREALRLYPPAWMISRQAIEDTTLVEYTVPRGTAVMVNVFGMHRDERFFPDPLTFNPERFSPENDRQINKYAYLPFGGGPRICIGNAFAMMEAKLIVATIAQRYTLRHAPGHIAQPERVFTMRAKYGMEMVASRRESVTLPAGG